MQRLTSRGACAWILIALSSAAALSGCGGGGSDVQAPTPAPTPGSTPEPPPPPPSAGDPVAAAKATADNNPMCVGSRLGPYYWEIGDANGVLASGTVGSGAPTRTTPLWIFSASKWLYAANVVQKRGINPADVPFLNFTSGWSNFGNAPICVLGDTVGQCLIGRDSLDASTLGRFKYDSGHMQHHAANFMGLANADNAALAADLNATIGNFGFSYTVPQLAAGVVVSAEGYASFLRKMIRGELALGAALDSNTVCTSMAPPCNAASAPDTDTNEALNYGLGHWLEDDPILGDHAFSSPGGGGFYPWIDKTRTTYGILARQRETEGDAGFHSAQCGRLLRQAWRTGVEVTSTTPTPTATP